MKALLLALIAAALLVVETTAGAQTAPPYTYPLTLSTSPEQVLRADPQRKKLVFFNPNSTALVAVCPAYSRVDSTAISCAVNGAGSITLLPYSSAIVKGVGLNGEIPSAWNAVSDTAGAHLTILEFE